MFYNIVVIFSSGQKFRLGVKYAETFRSVLESDSRILAKWNIMDYSLLVRHWFTHFVSFFGCKGKQSIRFFFKRRKGLRGLWSLRGLWGCRGWKSSTLTKGSKGWKYFQVGDFGKLELHFLISYFFAPLRPCELWVK